MKKFLAIMLFWAAIFTLGIVSLSDAQITGLRPHNHSSASQGGVLPGGSIPWDVPGTIGSTTPNTGAFTSVVTPLVQTGSTVPLNFANNNGSWNIDGTLYPNTDNNLNVGIGTRRIANIFTSALDSGAIGPLSLNTNNGNTQFQVIHTAPSNRNITVTGSNGGNPTIGTTAGNLAITPLLAANGGLSSTTGAFSGTVSSTKACAVNYTRIGPNFCLSTGAISTVAIATTCTSVAAPSGALALAVKIQHSLTGGNVLNQLDQMTVDIYNDATCVTSISQTDFREREFVATAGATIAAAPFNQIIPVVAGNGVLKRTDILGGVSSAILQITGYFD